MKRIHFSPNLVDKVLNKEKTSTWRLWDDKNLTEGDIIELANSETRQVFAKAKITQIIEKRFKDLTNEDKAGHEKFRDENELFATFQKYYGKPVNENTILKIVRFKLL